MGTGYTRKDTSNNIANGNVIDADDLDAEFNGIEDAFNSSTGHTHDGTSAEGAPIEVTGPNQEYVSDATALYPKTDDTYDLGKTGAEWKDLYVDGTANIDSLVADTADINGGTIDGVTLGTNSAVTEAQVDNINIDGNAITSTDTDGNIALTPNGSGEVDISKVDIDGGTIDGTVIGGTTPAAISGTTGTFSGDLTVDTNTLYVDSANNRVGVGTTTGLEKLSVVSADTYQFSFKNNSASSVGALGYDSTDNMRVFVNGSERMRIDSSGNVGIGTSAPQSDLEIQSKTTGTDAVISLTAAGTRRYQIKALTSVGALAFVDESLAAERMRINSSGNVGIGTSSPAQKLHVSTAGNNYIVSHNTTGSTSALLIGAESGSTSIYSWTTPTGSTGVPLKFFTGATEAMRIDSSGNLLVGQSSSAIPGAGNTTIGICLNSVGLGSFSRSGAAAGTFNRNASNGTVVAFYRQGSSVGSISVTSSATSYNTSSDERLKENITDADDASGVIDGIQVRQFDWKADGEHQRYGMIAQELDTVAPEAVTKGEAEDDMWAVDYSKLVPMLVKEIQDLRKRVAELEQ